MEAELPKYLTLTQAAKELHISPRTLHRYMDAGIIEFSNVNPLGTRRRCIFSSTEIEAFYQKHKSTLPNETRPKRAYNMSKNYRKYARKKKKPGGMPDRRAA